MNSSSMAGRKESQSVMPDWFGKINVASDTFPLIAAQWGEKPSYISDIISQGSYLRVVPWLTISPSEIFVNLFQNWDNLELYQQQLQPKMKYLADTDVLLWPPERSLLAPGLFVVTFCECGKGGNEEWYRAQILTCTMDPFKVAVRLIDFGCTGVVTKIKDICYMRRDILLEFPAQSIQVKLHFDSCNDQMTPEWSYEAHKVLAKMMDKSNNSGFGMHFIKRVQHPSWNDEYLGKDNVWVVTLNILEPGDKSAHSSNWRHVGTYNEVLEDEGIGQELDRREKRKKKPKSKFSTPNAYDTALRQYRDHGEYITRVVEFNAQKKLEQYIIK